MKKEKELIDTIPADEKDEAERIEDVIKEVVNREYLATIYGKGQPVKSVISVLTDEEFEELGYFARRKLEKKVNERFVYHLKAELTRTAEALHGIELNTPAARDMIEYAQLLTNVLNEYDKRAKETWRIVLENSIKIAGSAALGITMYALGNKFGEIPGQKDAKPFFLKNWFSK